MELLNAETLIQLFGHIIGELGEKGNCVIVGRAAPWFLRERADTFRVFLYAPHDEKVRRTVEAGVRQDEAERLVETVDRERATFIRQYYNHEWPSRPLYHLMINTAMGNAIAVKTILDGIDMMNITRSLLGA
jgi:cytidylate kinase